jgi:predicted RNA-binding Zn ribbon-like protein
VVLAHDTARDIVAAAALVNTAARGDETLTDVGALTILLDKHGFTGRRDGTLFELRQVRALRPRLRAAWEAADVAAVVELANRLLRDAHARPWLIDHDGWGWHLHVSELDAPLADRLAAEAGMAFADFIRAGELDRLRVCAADDCDAVLVDLTRNRSRIYCDTGNCGNRQHVAAYRARRKTGEAAR